MCFKLENGKVIEMAWQIELDSVLLFVIDCLKFLKMSGNQKCVTRDYGYSTLGRFG